MDNLYFVTSNEFKLKEASEILGIKIKSININVDEIQDIDIDKIIKHKVIASYKAINKPVMVEDTGLYIEALNGFPGGLIKWLMKSIGTTGSLEFGTKNNNIIKLLENYNNKKIYAKTSVAIAYSYETIIITNGILKGAISNNPVGNNGFGWDDIFIPEGYNKTLAQMTIQQKNEISMRKIAFSRIKEHIGTLFN